MITCPEATRAAPTPRPEPVREKCSAGPCPPPQAIRPASRTRHSYVALAPKNVPIAGCGQGECSAGACPQLGEGHGPPPELVIRTLRLLPRMCRRAGCWACGGAPPASRTRHSYVATGPKNDPIVGCGCGKCSAGACPPLGEGQGPPPELVIRMLRLVPRMTQSWGVGVENVALGLVPSLGRGTAGLPNSSFVRCDWSQECANCGVKVRGTVALGLVPSSGRGIGSADDPQTLPPTRRPHRRRDGFQTRPGRGWGTPTPTGYRSGSTTVRNGNR